MQFNMRIWKLFILTCILSASEGILPRSYTMPKESFLEGRLISAKVELARSFNHRKRDSSKLLNVSTTEPLVFEVGFNGGSSFWAFSQILVLADSSIYRLHEIEGSLKLDPVAKLPDLAFADQLAFVKAVEWRRILFILVALRSGYCRLYTATPPMKITQRQTIHNFGPQDAEFFIYKNELFLIIISSKPGNHIVPSYIYRWTGTHFDEIETFMTKGAVAVSTFPFKGAVIITVAQYPEDNPVIGSQVFRWSQKKLERMQFLATNGPVALQFLEAHGESYLLVINSFEFSTIFWWTGREFINWDSLYDVKDMNKISIGYTDEETLILIAKNDKIQIYKLLENKLQRLTTISLFDGEEIISMTLHMNADSRLIVISKKSGVLSTSIFHLQLVKGHTGDYKQKMDPLLQCLIILNDKLLSKDNKIKRLKVELPNVLSVKKDITLKGKMVVNATINVKTSYVSTIETVSNKSMLFRNALQIESQIRHSTTMADTISQTIFSLVRKSSPRNIYGKIHVLVDLFLEKSLLDQANINKLNEKSWEHSNMLTYRNNQVLAGAVGLGTLVTSELNVTILNGIPLEDFLQRGANQVVSGYHKVKELTVNKLYMPQEYINQIGLSTLVKKHANVVQGHKKLHSLHTSNLPVVFLKDVNATNMEMQFVLKTRGNYKVEALTFVSELIIKDLKVEEINGIEWDLFKSSIFLKGENQHVNGSLQFLNNMKVDYLSAGYLNNTITRHIMTYKTDQDILSVIEVQRLKTNDLNGELFNGLNIFLDVAQMENINHVHGLVLMKNIKLHNLTTDKETKWIGILKQEEIKQLTMYNNRVVIFGNLQVEDVVFADSLLKITDLEFDIAHTKGTYWTYYQNQIIKEKIIKEKFKIVGDMILKNLNKLYVKYLYHIIASDEIYGVNFECLKITGEFNLKKPATMSGINVQNLNKTAVMSTGHYMVYGQKKFFGGLLGDCVDTNWIDGREILDMVPLNGLSILGRKRYAYILVREDLHAENDAIINVLNNIHLASAISLALQIDKSFSLQSIMLSSVIGDNIETSMINKVDFNNFVKTLKLETSTIIIKEVTIHGDVEFLGHLNMENMNGLQLYPYLCEVIHKETGGVVLGKKEFVQDTSVFFLEAGIINKVDMTSLQKYSLSKTKSQNITGYFSIKRISLDNFSIKEISGKKIINAVLVKGNTFHATQANIVFLGLYAEGNLRVQKISNCNITRVGAYLHNSIKVGHFETLNVTHKMNWEISNHLKNSFSNLLTKAVKKYNDNFIDGGITFHRSVYSQLVITRGNINGIDLRAIANDCMKKSSMEQELYGRKIFISSINTSRAEAIGNANIKLVNGVDIIKINETLVRKMQDKQILGHKHFLNGFRTEKLKSGGKVKDISISTIATTDSNVLPPAEIQHLLVSQNLNFKIVNSIDLNQLLTERINCCGIQEINCKIVFNGNTRLLGETRASSINNMKLHEIMITESQLPQELAGRKIFQHGIVVNGKVDVSLVNGHNLKESYRFGIQANEDVEIYGNLVFTDGIKMDADININNLVNIFDLFSAQKNAMKENYRKLEKEQSYNSKMDYQISENLEIIKGIPTTFMYLEYKNNFKIQEINATSADLTTLTDKVLINIRGMDKNECGLPNGCLCPVQYEVELNEEGYNLSLLEANKRRFIAYDYIGKRGAELLTNTVSQENECKLPPEELRGEFNKIVWMIWNYETRNLTYNLDIDTYNFEGYVSDMKSLSVENDFYLAVAIYYDAIKSSHNINSFILKWSLEEATANIFQYIPTFGAKVLDLFHSKEGVHLYIGNSYDSELKTNYVNDEIYRLNKGKTEFELLRTIQTRGTHSVKSFTLNDESFIIMSQQLGSPVIILKYIKEHDNFYLYQKLHFGATTIGLGVFYAKDDGYLGIAVMDGSFHLYKYSHIEGFKKLMSQRQKGIQSFVPFYTGDNQFILTPSLLETRIMHAVMQGAAEY